MELWFYMGLVTPPIHFGRVILRGYSSIIVIPEYAEKACI